MKITAVLYPGMTALDLIGPMQVLCFLPGAQIQTVWKSAGPVLTDSSIQLTASHSFADSHVDPDILIIGGAGGPTLEMLREPEMLAFLADRGARAKWVVSVCTGSLILGAAGLLKGYRASSYWSVREALVAFGATPCHERVVCDGNRLTGGGITAGIDVGLTLAGKLLGEDYGRMMELMLEYAPAPPFGTGRPELAGDALTSQVKAMMDSVISADMVASIAREKNGSEA